MVSRREPVDEHSVVGSYMEEDEELDAFLLEEQMIMNQQQQQQLRQTNDVPQSQVLMDTITTTTTTTTTTATNTRAEDIISWLGIDDDDGDVYIPSLPPVAAVDDNDAHEVLIQENIYNNLQMESMDHHQVGVLEGDDNNNNDDEGQTLFMNVFHHHPNPIIINPHDHIPVPESPFLLDLLCNINDLEIRPSHHRVLEETPPETNYHQLPSSSCFSPPLVDQNQYFDDPDVSEFTLINDDDVENHDLLISTPQLVNASSATRDHINEDHNTSHDHQNVDNVTMMVNKDIINATDGATTIDQGDGDDDEDNEEEEMDANGDGENPNSKTMISTTTSTSSLLASPSASASVSACKNLVSERNRRKRLSQQLLALRSLVPNITKMDKRSVLVDALAYLRNIHEETMRLQSELKLQPPPPPQSNMMSSTTTTTTTATTLALREEDNLSGSLCIPRPLSRTKKTRAIITEIDTERIENQRFVVKITCKVKGGSSSSSSSGGVGGDVLRVMESLGFDITYTSTATTPPHLLLQTPKPQNQQLLTTLFIRVRNNKHGKMTEEKLKECISNRALRCGLTFQKPTTTTTTIVPFKEG